MMNGTTSRSWRPIRTNTNTSWDGEVADYRAPFLEFAGTKPGDRVLDVGCGTGILTSALAERGPTVVGIDASEAYVADARGHRSNPEVTYDLGDVRQLPYGDSSFDTCVSTLVLDIIPEFERVVGKCVASRALAGSSGPGYSISGAAFLLLP